MGDASVLENRVRRVIAARLERGDKGPCASAAGHQAPWLSKWLAGERHATLDEMARMARFVKISLGKIIAAPDGDDLDWQVFGLMGRIEDDKKADALQLVAGLVDGDVLIVARPSTESATQSRRREVHKSGSRG